MQIERRFNVDPPKRILALGSPGSLRTQAARAAAVRFDLPLIRLDEERARFRKDPEGWRIRIEELAIAPAWAMVGGDIEALDHAVQRADWLIYFDLSASLCCLRVLVAALRERGRDATRFSWLNKALKAWRFPNEEGLAIADAIAGERRNRTIFIFHSAREVRQFLADVARWGAEPPHEGQQS